MSEVQRFWSHEASNIRCVREADFDRVTAERDAALGDAESLRESLRTQTLIINSVANARDAALGREAECQRQLGERWKDIDALKTSLESAENSAQTLHEVITRLQQRLNAANEALDKAADEFSLMRLEAGQRMDVLEGLLRDASAWIKHNSFHGTDAIELWERIDAELKQAEGGGDDWKSWAVGNTVRYQGSGQDGEDCYCRMRKGSDYLIHEAPDDHESMVVLDDDGDELCVLVGEFKWIKP